MFVSSGRGLLPPPSPMKLSTSCHLWLYNCSSHCNKTIWHFFITRFIEILQYYEFFSVTFLGDTDKTIDCISFIQTCQRHFGNLCAAFKSLAWVLYAYCQSQAARQGLAVLMVIVQVGLKWYNSTAYQSHNYESFVFKFCKGDNVTRINNPAKFD